VALNESVTFTPELERVIKLPQQRTDDSYWAGIAAQLTELLRLPQGSQSLRVDQGHALHDVGVYGGAFCPIEVSGGKTLISLMVPYILESKRTLLLEPAGLIDKTNRAREKYAKHWPIPTSIRILSYEILGRTQAEHELEKFNPDLIIADEAHRLKNRRAAVTRRVARYMEKHPDTRFVALSGTIMSKSLLDFGHVLRWCLKENAPVPRTQAELEEWAAALDEKMPNGDELRRYEVGALLNLCTPEEIAKPEPGLTPTVAARRGFRRRLVETPGVVSTVGGEHIGASLYIHAKRYSVEPITDAHFAKLRGSMLTPDDWELMSGADVWRHARELALGFHYVWDPRPPQEWRDARRAWNALVREVLAHSRTLDSPKAVALAVDAGKLPNAVGVLERWREIKPTFRENVVAIWHDHSALNTCAEWMQQPGIVWTEHVLFAEKLAELTGAPYYGGDGLTADGKYIEDADGKTSIIASIDANKDGKNLQEAFWRNLVTCPPDGALVWQQMIGRTHRTGQPSDQVEVDVFLGCLEHANAWRNAVANAGVVRDTMGSESKLLTADVDWPSDDEIATFSGARWRMAAPERSTRRDM
jgi:hypothetical protein